MRVNGRRIQSEIEEDAKRAELLTKDGRFNEQHCLRCFDKFFFFFKPKLRCASCGYWVCKKCAPFNKFLHANVCTFCLKQRWDLESILLRLTLGCSKGWPGGTPLVRACSAPTASPYKIDCKIARLGLHNSCIRRVESQSCCKITPLTQ